MKKHDSAPFCAICTKESDALVARPLGRNDALVSICIDCDEAPPVEVNGPDRDYAEVQGISSRDARRQLDRVHKEIGPNDQVGRLASRNEMMRNKTPGWIIVRVSLRDAFGQPRDHHVVARVAFVDKPWADVVRYLGSTRTHHLFERPDPELLAKIRASTDTPLAAIEAFRSKP